MANKLKNSAGKKVKADPKKADSKAFKKEKEESVDWKKLARDERTWKIAGALFLLTAVFLLVAFISYFFTWKEDQAKVFRGGSSFWWTMILKFPTSWAGLVHSFPIFLFIKVSE